MPQTASDSTRQHRHRADSVYRRDSIVIRTYVAGDTVYVDRWRDRVLDRVSVRTDTVYKTREVTVTTPPERYVPTPVKGLAWIGAAAIVVLIAVAAGKVIGRR